MKLRAKAILTSMIVAGSLYAGGDVVPVAPVAPVNANECGTGFYVGAGAAIQRMYGGKSSWTSYEKGQDKTVPLLGILGYKFNCYLAVEGRVSQTVYEEDYADILTYSFFVKPMYPVTEDINIYALIGYGVVDAEYTDGRAPAPKNLIGQTIVDKGAFQWGFGASYDITENWSIFADYTMLMYEQSVPARPLYFDDVPAGRTWDHISDDSINVGVTYSF